MRHHGRVGAVLMLFYKHRRAPRPATWATQRPLRWLWGEERSPPASLQEENQRENQIKLHNDKNCSAPLMMLHLILLLVCFIKLTHLSNLFLSGTWGPREKNDLFYLWRLLLLDRRICACSCHLWINLYGSTDLALTILVKIQMSSSRAAWSWFETDSERRDVEQAQGKRLGRGKKPAYVLSKPSIWHRFHQCGYPHSLSPTFSWWLNAIYMHSATTKALLLQIAHGDRHVFLIQPWEDNHCSSEKNVQKLTHTSSKGFYPRDLKILQFLRQALPMKRKKKSLQLNSLQVKYFNQLISFLIFIWNPWE